MEFCEYEDFCLSFDMSNWMINEEFYDCYEIMNLFLNEFENIIIKIMSEMKYEIYDYVFYDYYFLVGFVVVDFF